MPNQDAKSKRRMWVSAFSHNQHVNQHSKNLAECHRHLDTSGCQIKAPNVSQRFLAQSASAQPCTLNISRYSTNLAVGQFPTVPMEYSLCDNTVHWYTASFEFVQNSIWLHEQRLGCLHDASEVAASCGFHDQKNLSREGILATPTRCHMKARSHRIPG